MKVLILFFALFMLFYLYARFSGYITSLILDGIRKGMDIDTLTQF